MLVKYFGQIKLFTKYQQDIPVVICNQLGGNYSFNGLLLTGAFWTVFSGPGSWVKLVKTGREISKNASEKSKKTGEFGAKTTPISTS